MMLELKESNSPFWLIGFQNKKYIAGTDGNIPCYHKSLSKQKQLAVSCINNRHKVSKIDEYYLISGLVWDNMPNENNQVIYSYVKTKGKLLATTDDIISEEKNECQINHDINYPKGVSRNSLVNKRKVYTNKGMALEDKKISNLELNIKNEDLINGVTELNVGDKIQSDTNKDVIYEIIKIFINEEGQALLYCKNLRTGKEIEIDPKGIFAKGAHKLKEAAAIKPIGASQQSDAFVNIEIDLDNVTISDYIVRLAQIIRSEQKAILEIDALLASDGIVGADRKDIEEVREDEKDHMVVYSRLLRKAIESGFKSNEDRVDIEQGKENKNEDKTKKESLKEAIEIANNYLKENYYGYRDEATFKNVVINTLKCIQNQIDNSKNDREKNYYTTRYEVQLKTFADKSGASLDEFKQIINRDLQNENNANDNSKTEEDYKTWLADGRRELLKTWTNNDLKALYKWCETELDDSLAKDVVGWVIRDELNLRDDSIMNEDINISPSESMNQDQYDILVDVNYDNDFLLQTTNNLINAVEEFNKEYNPKGIGIDSNTVQLANNQMNFILIVKNIHMESKIDNSFIKTVCKYLCDKATTYEYFIELID